MHAVRRRCVDQPDRRSRRSPATARPQMRRRCCVDTPASRHPEKKPASPWRVRRARSPKSSGVTIGRSHWPSRLRDQISRRARAIGDERRTGRRPATTPGPNSLRAVESTVWRERPSGLINARSKSTSSDAYAIVPPSGDAAGSRFVRMGRRQLRSSCRTACRRSRDAGWRRRRPRTPKTTCRLSGSQLKRQRDWLDARRQCQRPGIALRRRQVLGSIDQIEASAATPRSARVGGIGPRSAVGRRD